MQKKIVIIDDEPGIREVLRIHLNAAGYEVFSADCATGGLDLVRTSGPDMVICDYALPDLRGLDLVATIKSERPGIPLVIISGFLEDSIEDEAREAGVVGCLKKPFSKKVLLDAVAVHIGDHRAEATGTE